MSFFSAQARFRLNSPNGYNIPKPKFLFYVNFVSRYINPEFLASTGFFVKTISRIQTSYDVAELNQYNKKRLVQTKVNYEPFSLTMYDTVDNNGLRMFEAYNRFYYGDFDGKTNHSWYYDITSDNFENNFAWGLKANGGTSDGYFFDRIEVYEIFDQYYTKVSFINPKLTNTDFDGMDMESSDPTMLSMSFKYEGLVFEKVNEPVTEAIAEMVGLPLKDGFFGLNGGVYRIPGLEGLINFGTNLVTNVLTGFGVNAVTANNLSVALANQGVTSVLGKQLSGGDPKFDRLGNTIGLITGIGDRVGSGRVVRDVATGTLYNNRKNLFI